MLRTLLVSAVIAALALPCRADQAGSGPETLIRLRVAPAPAPRPALRHQLLPEHHERNPGNPIHAYLLCFMEQQKFFYDKETVRRREALLAMPLKELPAQELREYGGFALSQADWAARLDAPDWQILLRLKSDGAGVLLPDVQQLQPLANALKVRFRAEVALRRFDDALRTAKTLFAMARHLGEHPTIVGNLEGFAIATLAIGPLEEMLEQTGCPNLYWALTNLPRPLVPLDKGIAGERDIFLALFRDLDDGAAMTEDQLKRYIAPLDVYLHGGRPLKPGATQSWIDARTKDEAAVDAARRRLVAYGLPEDRLRRFPAEQVILLDAKREYEVRRDDILKLANVPVWEASAMAAAIDPGKEPALFTVPMLEGLLGVPRAQARLDRRIALLRHVEALRLFAAEHNGTLPAKLSEIPLPLPVDPITGQPFRYEVDGATAHLRGSPPPGDEMDPRFTIHYEVSLQR